MTRYLYVVEAWLDGEPAAVVCVYPRKKDAVEEARMLKKGEDLKGLIVCKYHVTRFVNG